MHVTLRIRHPWQPPSGPDEPAPAEHAGMPSWLAERLFDRRIVFLTGRVTPHSASTAAAALLTLDAMDAGGAPAGFAAGGSAREAAPVYLHLAAPDGDLTAVFTVVDAIDSIRAPVHAVATGEVGGAAVGVLAAAQKRLSYPHARFRLAEPAVADLTGTADDVAAAAGTHLRALEDLVVRVAQATGQPRSRVEDDFSTGRLLDAGQARDYGLIDEIRSRSA